MTLEQWLKKYNACSGGRKWAIETGCKSIEEIWLRDDLRPEWRIWVACETGALTDSEKRLFACACVREVWHLLEDERSRNAVEVAERFALGNATEEELKNARELAYAAASTAIAANAAYAAYAAYTANAANAANAVYAAATYAAHAVYAAGGDREASIEAQASILLKMKPELGKPMVPLKKKVAR